MVERSIKKGQQWWFQNEPPQKNKGLIAGLIEGNQWFFTELPGFSH